MLDIHPPEHTPHTWRDFFIHIVTIVVGLIIAVGLEQTVELVHHQHQITETREALRQERAENYTRFARYVEMWGEESALQQADMAILTSLQHPAAGASLTAAGLRWSIARNQFATAAWHTAQTSGVTALLPAEEVRADERVYSALQDVSNQNEEEWLALNDANRFAFTDPDASHLNPAQLLEEITLMQKVMMKHYLRGNFMEYPNSLDSRFAPGPSEIHLHEFHHLPATVHARSEPPGAGAHL